MRQKVVTKIVKKWLFKYHFSIKKNTQLSLEDLQRHVNPSTDIFYIHMTFHKIDYTIIF